MYQHPVLVEALMKDRVAGLRHSAGAGSHVKAASCQRRLVASVRQGTGWLLVDLGLKLATPRGGASHAVARGQR